MINFENLDKFTFPGVGKYDIPQIEPVKAYPNGEFIPVNYHYTAKDTASKIIHFFVDDYRFIRYWNTPDKYIPKLSQFAAVCAPDFSTYTDMPLAMQIYNHYRKHWLAAYWQMHGMTVYPSVSWSDECSYDWCFDGEPVGGIVAVSSVGTQQNKKKQAAVPARLRRNDETAVAGMGDLLREGAGGMRLECNSRKTAL